MKWLLIFPGFLLLTSLSVNAQRIKLFRSVIYTNQGERIDGILYDVADSTVRYMADSPKSLRQFRLGSPDILSFPIADINRVTVTRRRPLRTENRVLFGMAVVGSLGVYMIPNNGGSWGDGLYRGAFRPLLLVLLPLASLAALPRSGFFPRKTIRFNVNGSDFTKNRTTLSAFAYRPQSINQKIVPAIQP